MSKKIVIIDDEIEIRSSLKEAFGLEGYRVDSYPSCDDLLTRFIADPPDLIILDLMMPWQKGDDFIKRLLLVEELNEIPIYMITGKILTEDEKNEILSLGVREIISKPFDIEKLLKDVKKLFNSFKDLQFT